MSVDKWCLLGSLLLYGVVCEADKIQTIKKCCNLGTTHAASGLKCNDFPRPVPNISKEDQAFCFSSADACCKKAFREKQCKLGELDALTGIGCATSSENDSESFRKDCCEACKIGMESEASEEACNIELGLGLPMDSSFKSCCLNKLTTIGSTTSSTAISTTNKISFSPSPSSTTSTTTASTTSVINTSTTDSPSTTTVVTTQTNKALEKFTKFSTPPPPPLEALCDLPDLCDHICVPVGDSFKCDCHPGFVLMDNGKSCTPSKEPQPTSAQGCKTHNPCDQQCVDTGVAIKCSCYQGYKLNSDKRTCTDIDECILGIHNCSSGQTCVNTEGLFECYVNPNPCPAGYKLNKDLLVCNDINECKLNNPCPEEKYCKNTIGSYECVDWTSIKCPPGFYYKESIQNCDDVDECITGKNDCNIESQVCLNTKGNYTCIDKASKKNCPPGFKKNVFTQTCEDIDECEENEYACNEYEECINEPGGHNCIPKLTSTPYSIFVTPRSSILTTDPFRLYTPLKRSTAGMTTASTPKSRITQRVFTSLYSSHSSSTPKSTSHTLTTRPALTYRSLNVHPLYSPFQPDQFVTCSAGYKYSLQVNNCVDIDECLQNPQLCDSNQDCYNTQGSYTCSCKIGFTKDYHTGACVDVNECQLGQHDCIEGQRCDNTIGSYSCARTTGCGTGYTLNLASGICEDDDECALGIHTCFALGANFQCRNTLGSYRCERLRRTTTTSTTVRSRVKSESPTLRSSESSLVTPTTVSQTTVSNPFKRCLPGYKMNQYGTCEDIDECSSNPCKRNEKCLNLFGRYQCIPLLQCSAGYELNELENECIDINECTRGTHQCKSSQICKNGPGYYLCQCPPGHKLNAVNECEDIDECDFYRDRICSRNAVCINTIGSYECRCKEGFKESELGCDDINECQDIQHLCHQTCVNIWGSYRCSCERGFTLNSDNRTCSDVDECERFKNKNLCVGSCQNIPGSYVCTCPEGYRKGNDGRTCQDIDECQLGNACSSPDDVCVNTRGSYKCHRIVCPAFYVKDPEHKSRCKRASNVCDIRDNNCIRMPGQYSYHFVTFVSKLPIPEEGRMDFFQMKAPTWTNSYARFNMQVKNIRCPRNVVQADERFFLMKKDRNRNKVVVSLIRSIEGPQEIELQLQMELYISDSFQGKVISTVYVLVSEYTF